MNTLTRRIALTLLVFGLFTGVGLLAAQARALPGNTAGSQAQPDPADLATPAGAAVDLLTGPQPMRALSVLGADPRTVLGYEPTVIDGAPANPHGGCSTPVPLPDRFEPLCKIHDLGYDLLRAAALAGHPLGAWARERLDRTLVEAMHRRCSNPICETAADVADIGLTLNTWRQRGGDPVRRESLGAIALSIVVRSAEVAR